MSDPIIRVENLSKKYVLSHQEQGRSKYKSIRESLSNGVKSFGDKFLQSSDKKTYNAAREDFWALNDISFEIKQGDRVGIIGRNGAGKSTLLKVLSRITEPTTGRISIAGRIASLLEVGTGFHPELTGRENIFLNGAILGMSKEEIKKKFDEIVTFAEVEKFLDTPVKRYSSGMYVRLAFAVAAHLEPEILIVDEVLAVGDIQFQKKCLGKMEDVSAREGRTVIFVSHNMAAVQQLTNVCMVLQQGKLLSIENTASAIELFLSSSIDHSSSIYNVENKPRRFKELHNQVEFLTLELENYPTKLVPADSEILFHITVRGNEDVENFRFSMTLRCIDGTAVGTFFGQGNSSIRKGEIEKFQLELKDLRLAAGMYYCDVAVGKGNLLSVRTEFDIIFDVLHFEIMPEEGTDGVKASWDPSWGSIRLVEPVVSKVT